jgi:hypothetical protein
MYLDPIDSDVRRPKWFRAPSAGRCAQRSHAENDDANNERDGQIGSRELRR